MRTAIVLIAAFVVSCAPRAQLTPCNDHTECLSGDTCVLGTCRAPLDLVELAPSVTPRDPEPLGDVVQFAPRATAGLVMLLAPDERSGHAPVLNLDDAPSSARAARFQCTGALTLEVMTRNPLSSPLPLLRGAGLTLVGAQNARHHVITVEDGVARRYQNGGLMEVVEVDTDPSSDLVEILQSDEIISLASMSCNALSHREVRAHARFGDVLPARTTDDVVVRYRFAGDARFSDEGDGDPLDLVPVGETADVLGGVYLEGARLDGGFAPKIEAAISQTRAFTLEMWLVLEEDSASANLMSSSPGQNSENFSLGVEDGRVAASAREMGFLGAPLPAGQLTHLVFTHDGSAMRLYRGGRLVQTRTSEAVVFMPGRFGLGSELTGERPFFGVLYDAAISSAALDEEQVETHFLAGPEATSAAD